jgi:hypothetical protein
MTLSMEIKSVEDILSEDFICPDDNCDLQPAIEMATLYFPFAELKREERRTFKARVNEMIDRFNDNMEEMYYSYL